MEYHKSNNPLILKEYGRNVQRMTEYLLTVEDTEKRSQLALEVIRVMNTLAPNVKEVADYKKKLWDHLHLIGDYHLGIEGPYPAPTPPPVGVKEQRMSYYAHAAKFRQYGKNVELMVHQALEMEDGPDRTTYILQLANYMRTCLAAKGNDNGALTDQTVFEHLAQLSNGRIRLSADQVTLQAATSHGRLNITNSSQPVYQRKRKKFRKDKPKQRRPQGGGQPQAPRRFPRPGK